MEQFVEGDSFPSCFKKLSRLDKQSLASVSRTCRRKCFANITSLEIRGLLTLNLALLPPYLHTVQMRGIWIDMQAVPMLAALTSLTCLDLQNCYLDDVEQLSTLRSLRELNLNRVSGIKNLRGMASLTHLHTLHVGHSDVDRVYLHQLSTNLPQLLSLDVAWSRGITHTGAQDTFRYTNLAGGLTQLILDGYSDMRNLNPLRLLASLRSFSMRNCLCQDPWLDSFVYLPQLTTLCLSANPDLLDRGVGSLAQSLPILETLELNGLTLITFDSLRALEGLSRLSMLSLKDCPQLPTLSPLSAVGELVLGLQPSLRAAIAKADAFERSYFA